MKKAIFHILFILLYTGLLWAYNGSLEFARPGDYPEGIEYAKATVSEVVESDVGQDPDYSYIRIGKQTLKLEINSGPHKGTTVQVLNFVTRTTPLEGTVGTRYILGSYDGFITANIMSYERSGLLVLLLAAFLGMVILYGRKKGLAAVAALVVTLLNVVFLFIPMLINGVPAIPAAILVVLLSTLYTMVVLNGLCKKSLIATACCTLCTAFAGVLAWLVGRFGWISTLNTPEVENLLFITENTKFRIDNLLTAGILISSMGAVMDTCMSIVSSLYELRDQNPAITPKQLRKSGMNIGKDIMGTMTNTLILAFVGSSLNLIVIYYMYCMPAISLLNTDFIVVEAVKGLIGSMAVVMSIPCAAALTAAVLGSAKTTTP
ncbi:MAG: YibE/F family protein [Clostridiales bacterium]|nr:YibE/F family protein [Clostridiales bacterium]